MIDVHPPHQPIHGWRDFLLHIATITIGLLIALGLEAIAEAIHHRHQVAETRESLRSEREENRRRFAANTAYQLRQGASLTNNLLVLEFLQQHSGTPESQLPGFLRWTSSNARMTQSAWENSAADRRLRVHAARRGSEGRRTLRLPRTNRSSPRRRSRRDPSGDDVHDSRSRSFPPDRRADL